MKRNRVLTDVLGGFLVALVLIGLASYFAKPANAAWFNESWLYRKAINISTHNTTENNVYINLTGASALDTSDTNRFQADCGDLRFTKQNGELLPYYIVSGCGTSSTVVHVEFNTFPAGAQTVYYYYGNPSAANGFSSADFTTQASSYTIGSLGSEEQGPGPVGYWKFDEGQGTIAKDSSSDAFDGTLTNSPTWATGDQCISEKCLYFDGSNSYIELSSKVSKFNQSYGTIEFWVKPEDLTSNKSIFYLGDAGATYFVQFGLRGDIQSGTLGLLIKQNGNDLLRAYDYGVFTSSKWYHVAVTMSPTGNTLYVNGVAQSLAYITGSSSTVYWFNTINASSTILQLGGNSIATSQTLKGYLDEYKIYPYARSLAQIRADYMGGKATTTSKTGASAALGSKGQDWITNGLVGYWKMDEASWSGTSADVIDSSGNGQNGTATCTGASCTDPTGGAPGHFGNGGLFDGSEDYVTTPGGSIDDFQGKSITISVWVNPTTTTYGRLVTQYATIGLTNYGWWVNTDGTSNGVNFSSCGDAALPVGQWTHVVAVFDKDQHKNIIYKNGVLCGSASATGNINRFYNNFTFGANVADWFNPFGGTLDDIRIYNRALSPKEVSDLYNWAPGPVGYWRMDDKVKGASQTIVDTSGYGNNGTTYGSGIDCNKVGKYGGACSFNGVDDYISAGTPTLYNMGSGNMTLEAWANISADTNNWGNIIGKGSWNDALSYGIVNSWDLGKNCIEAYLAKGGNPDRISTSGSAYCPTSNSWHHYAAVFNRSANLTLYVDGVAVSSANITSYNATSFVNAYSLIMGQYDNSWYAKSTVDDVKIYNYARTQKQVVEDMNGGHPAGGSPVGSQVGYWKFDEGYGTTANNSGNGGSALNGTLSGTTKPTWTNSGKYGKALIFDGSSSYITGSDTNFPSGSNPRSISAWFYPTALPNNTCGVVFEYGTQSTNSTSGICILSSSGTYKLRFIGWNNDFDTTYSFALNTWYHVVAVFDGTTATVYLNGAKLSSSTAYSAWSTTLNKFYIGGDTSGPANYFTGSIDEVKVYNYALTADEVKLDYNHGSSIVMGSLGNNASSAKDSTSQQYCIPGDTSPCSAPVGEWNFEEGSGTSANDSSGNGFVATLGASDTYKVGKVGKAMQNSGSGAGATVSYGAGSALDFTSSTHPTIEFWLKVTSLATDSRFLEATSTGGWGVEYQTNGGMNINCFSCTGGASFGTGIVTADSSWHHFAITYDGTNAYLYKDGILKNTVTTSPQWTSGAKTLYIGGDSSYPLRGYVDQIRVFNYARTAAQVAYDYNRGAPVGWWKFDECQGTATHDSSGNNNNGTINIGATGTQTSVGTCSDGLSTSAWNNGKTGKRNYSLNFDGVDDYVNMGASSVFDIPGPKTISLWFNTSDTSNSNEKLVTKRKSLTGVDPVTGYSLDFNPSSGLIRFFNTGVTGNPTATISNYSGKWVFVVGTYDGSTAKIYANGVLLTSVPYSDGSSNSNPLLIGAEGGGALDFKGQIDDVQIYNYALTATQVKDIYNNGAVNFGPSIGAP